MTRRWTPLVIRELLYGSTRFTEIRRGVLRMSPSLLSRRLDELEESRRFWLVVDRNETDLCRRDPDYGTDLEVRSELRTMTEIWRGRVPFGGALKRGQVELQGPTALRRSFPDWLGVSLFADVSTGVEERPAWAEAAAR